AQAPPVPRSRAVLSEEYSPPHAPRRSATASVELGRPRRLRTKKLGLALPARPPLEREQWAPPPVPVQAEPAEARVEPEAAATAVLVVMARPQHCVRWPAEAPGRVAVMDARVRRSLPLPYSEPTPPRQRQRCRAWPRRRLRCSLLSGSVPGHLRFLPARSPAIARHDEKHRSPGRRQRAPGR